MNPERQQLSDYRPARITICLLVFIPDQIGYYAHRFEVLKLCIQSLIKNTDAPHDLLVLDNGSCAQVIDFLRSLYDQGVIQYLILSENNVGIQEALKIMFHSAPGEIIAYSQDDVLFLPGWLQAHLEILDTFPRVGMVSGVPVRAQFQYGNRYLQTYISDFPVISVKNGLFIPDEWERAFYISTGRNADEEMAAARLANQDIVLEYKGIKAYSTAVHFQYVAFKEVIIQGLSKVWEARLMAGPDVETDERIDALGYARLSTIQRYVQHIGNVITPELNKRVASLGLASELITWRPPMPFIEKMLHQRIIRGILARLHNWSYFLLRYQGNK